MKGLDHNRVDDSARAKWIGDVFVAICCDGATNTSHGDAGARALTDHLPEAIAERFDDWYDHEAHMRDELFELANELIATRARELDVEPGELYTTLSGFAFREKKDFEPGKFFAFSVGDGLVAARPLREEFRVLLHPANSKNNASIALGFPLPERHKMQLAIRFGDIEKYDALFAGTDGLAPFFYSRNTTSLISDPQSKKALANICLGTGNSNLRQREKFLTLTLYSLAGGRFSDDLSIVVAARKQNLPRLDEEKLEALYPVCLPLVPDHINSYWSEDLIEEAEESADPLPELFVPEPVQPSPRPSPEPDSDKTEDHAQRSKIVELKTNLMVAIACCAFMGFFLILMLGVFVKENRRLERSNQDITAQMAVLEKQLEQSADRRENLSDISHDLSSIKGELTDIDRKLDLLILSSADRKMRVPYTRQMFFSAE